MTTLKQRIKNIFATPVYFLIIFDLSKQSRYRIKLFTSVEFKLGSLEKMASMLTKLETFFVFYSFNAMSFKLSFEIWTHVTVINHFFFFKDSKIHSIVIAGLNDTDFYKPAT